MDLPQLSSPIIRAGMLRLESQYRERQLKWRECLWKAFDLIAAAWLQTQGTLSETELNEQIPALVLEAGVEFGWIPYPRQHQVQRRRQIRDAWIQGSEVIDWVWVNLPESELVESCGRFRFEAGFWNWFQNVLSGRIAHWQAEVLLREANLGVAADAVPAGLATATEPVPVTPSKRGRRPLPYVRKQQALKIRDGGGSYADAAKALYNTSHPTTRQIKDTSKILKRFRESIETKKT